MDNGGKMDHAKRMAGKWRSLRLWLPSFVMFCIMAGTMLSIFLSLKATVWCYFTDDVSIRENALDGRARMVLWEEPYRAPGEMSKLADVAGLSFAPNGGSVAFGQNVPGQAGTVTNYDLFVSDWSGREWGKPVALDSINTTYNEKDPAFSPDGKYLFFSSDRPGGAGGYDIWVARWDGVKWTGIINAGPVVNSSADEVAPAVFPDGRRLYLSSNRPGPGSGKKGASFDIFLGDITVKEPVAATNAVPAAGGPVTNVIARKKAAGSAKQAPGQKTGKGKAGKRMSFAWAGIAAAKAGEPAPVPEFGSVARDEVLNSRADDLYVSFSPGRDFAYLASDRKGGSGGFDIYCSRIVDGNLLAPVNQGVEINSTEDDTCPAVRMNGYDVLFSSGRGSWHEMVYASTVREVTSRLDLTRLDSLIGNFLDAKWWILAFVVGLALLVYLVRHYKDLTNLYHKCLMASAIVHMVLVVVVSFWKISEKMVEPEEGRQQTKVEFTVNVDNLAHEKLALNMAEDVTKLPASEVTVIARQANEFLPLADFVPQEKNLQTVVARSTMTPVQLESAPSKAAEISVKGEEDKIAPVPDKLGKLPEMEMPGADMIMEVRQPSAIVETKAAEEFQPVMNVPGISLERSDQLWARPATNLFPIGEAAGVAAVPAATGSVVGVTSLSGDSLVQARDTGGNAVRLSGGNTDTSTGASELKGPGETISMRLASTGSDDVFKLNAMGKLDVPEGFSAKVNPYMLRKGGRQSDQVVEGLGGSGVTEAAVERALDWFKGAQEPDGSWSIKKYGGQAGHDSAASGMTLLCYMGWGCKHTQPGRYQATVQKGVEWLAKQVKSDGNIMGNGGNMYDQGIATLALAEAYGLTKDKKLWDSVTNAVAFIVRAQNKNTGGWRYKPGESGDTSVFGWQVMALKSAHVAGIEVPQETFDLAGKWLSSVGGGEHGGLYGYTGKDHSPAMAAEAMFSRQLLSTESTHPAMRETVSYLNTSLPKKGQVNYYYWYYGSLSLHQHQGEVWEEWNRKMKELLIGLQVKEGENAGTWDCAGQHGKEMGRVVTSAMSTLTLEVYYRYLPILAGDNKKTGVTNENMTGAEKRAAARKQSSKPGK